MAGRSLQLGVRQVDEGVFGMSGWKLGGKASAGRLDQCPCIVELVTCDGETGFHELQIGGRVDRWDRTSSTGYELQPSFGIVQALRVEHGACAREYHGLALIGCCWHMGMYRVPEGIDEAGRRIESTSIGGQLHGDGPLVGPPEGRARGRSRGRGLWYAHGLHGEIDLAEIAVGGRQEHAW